MVPPPVIAFVLVLLTEHLFIVRVPPTDKAEAVPEAKVLRAIVPAFPHVKAVAFTAPEFIPILLAVIVLDPDVVIGVV